MKFNKACAIFFFFLILTITTPSNTLAGDFGYGSMAGYYTLSEVYTQLDNMYAKYPSLITEKEQVGTTIEGRPIYVVKISDNPTVDEDEPEVFYNALAHAREPTGMEVTIYYMYWLLENYESNDQAKYIVDNRELFFMPVVNPDGYYYNQTTNPNGGGSWRKNRRLNVGGTYGVDLNRNFGPQEYWDYPGSTGSSTASSSSTYRGTAPFSEPETQAIRDFLHDHYIKTAFNYHASGGDMPYPYSASQSQTTDSDIFKEWAYDMTDENRYISGLIIETLGYSIRGDVLDYMYDGDITGNHGKIFAYLPEVGMGDGFWPDQSRILPIALENLFANKYIAFVAGGYTDITSHTLSDNDLDPGDTIDMSLVVKNKGLGDMSSVDAVLTTSSNDVDIIDGSESVSALTSQTTQTITNAFKFKISEDIPIGTPISFTVNLKQNSLTLVTKTVVFYTSTARVIFSDTCDNIDNWTRTNTQSTLWETTTSTYHSSPSSCTDSKTGNYSYANKLNNVITLIDTIDLTGTSNPKLSFWTKYEIKSNWDYGMVQISTNDGQSWTSLSGNYTSASTAGVYEYVTGPLYSGSKNAWIKEEMDLSAYAGMRIKLRFLLSSYYQPPGPTPPSAPYIVRDGWYIDDITVFEYDQRLSDKINPKREWTDANGSTVKFTSIAGDNTFTKDNFPTLRFTKSSDSLSGLSGYEILIKPEGESYYSYIDSINDKPAGTVIDTSDNHIEYTTNEITIYLKSESHKLANGAYKWKVRAFDANGNNIESAEKILRINTLSANFNGDWFPLTLLSTNIKNQTPIFTGISTVGSKVNVTISQNNLQILSKEFIVDTDSRYRAVFTDKLNPGNYTVTISAVDKHGDYTEIPEFKLTIKVPVPRPTSSPSVQGEFDNANNQKPSVSPEPLSQRRRCFLWWCW